MVRLHIKAHEIVDLPEMIAPLPYLNFLRYFRRKHPRIAMRRILQEAPAIWHSLTRHKQNLFEKQVRHSISLSFLSYSQVISYLQRILSRMARFSRIKCLRLLLPRINRDKDLDNTRLLALKQRKRCQRVKRMKK